MAVKIVEHLNGTKEIVTEKESLKDKINLWRYWRKSVKYPSFGEWLKIRDSLGFLMVYNKLRVMEKKDGQT